MSETDVKKDIYISPKIFSEFEEESQVIVHCHMDCTEFADAARIWPSTYLIDNATGIRYPMVHKENITLYPYWTHIPEGSSLNFTLFFKGLPKSCKSFDLIEVIPQPGGFECKKIPRNKDDVYYILFG